MTLPEFPRRQKKGGRKGFSVIELLVGLSVVAILATLTIISIGRVKQAAKKTGCASNLRQMGMAAALYAQDNNGNLPLIYDLRLGLWGPPHNGLIDLLGGYLPDYRVFYCTEAERAVAPPALAYGQTYAYQSTQSSPRFHIIGYFWLICKEQNWDATLGGGTHKLMGSGKRVLAMCPHFEGSVVHNQKYNVLFVDGHVESRKAFANGDLISQIDPYTLMFRPLYDR